MKKSYPVVALLILAWLFSSCDGGGNPEPIQPSLTNPAPQVLPSDSPTPQTSPSDQVTQPAPVVTQSSQAQVASQALSVAQALPVRGRAPDTDYSREAFGSAWKDVDRNGCDTRNEILQRDFATVILKPGTGNCKVIGGTWIDPYSNVVSLKNAWQMGADQWTDQMRVEFANDPLNLRVTIASLNQQKSDSNAASWLPPFKPGRCAFIATQVAVKAKWLLYVTEAEKEVFIAILSKPECEQTQLPN